MNEALTQDETNGKVSAGERCSVRRVSAQEAALMMGRPGVRVIDVRTPVEFEGARVAGAESFPLDRLDPGLLRGSGGGSVLVFCQSGGRAGRAAERLAGAGVDGCVVVDGGMDAGVAAGLPAVRGAGGGFPLMAGPVGGGFVGGDGGGACVVDGCAVSVAGFDHRGGFVCSGCDGLLRACLGSGADAMESAGSRDGLVFDGSEGVVLWRWRRGGCMSAPVVRRRILIVGGVAGGASAAAKARRVGEQHEIHIFERGPYISFANCGLPYHIAGDIPDRGKLVVMTPEKLASRSNIVTHLRHEVVGIDRERKVIAVRDGAGVEREERYDKLILSQGARPFVPEIRGVGLPHVFTPRDIPDLDRIFAFLEERRPKRAVVVGGGFIGLEMAEAFYHRGMEVTVVERNGHLLPLLDADMGMCLTERSSRERFHVEPRVVVKGFSEVVWSWRMDGCWRLT